MADSDYRKSSHPPRKRQGFRRAWCCSFTNPPKSPENLTSFHQSKMIKSGNSYPNSPQSNRTSLGLVGRIDPRRILSPGRVSPIDSVNDNYDNTLPLDHSILDNLPAESSPVVVAGDEIGSEKLPEKSSILEMIEDDEGSSSSEKFDVRLSLKGKDEGSLVLEVDSKVLSENSSVFANLISEYHKNSVGLANLYRIEVPDVENLNAFHQTIELMYAEDITKRLVNMGVSRSIDALEVAAGIMFTKGVLSCLKYLEAVPWSEDDEEKLKSLFTRYTFDKRTTEDVLARLYSGEESINSQQNLAIQLINSVTNCTNLSCSKKELQSLVKGLLSKSSVYEKDLTGLKKDDLYQVCQSCLNSLVRIFQEATDSTVPEEEGGSSGRVESSSTRPFIERISTEVDNIKWLLEVLMEQQMAEEFVNVWAEQGDLLRMHEMVSPMVRYEVSRISASVFIALGKGKLLCQSESRCGVFQAWFGPMLLDYGWLQRCRKGLDVKVLEESMGQALLMLPMKHQHMLFMEWFQSYSRHGAECPNLSKAFQIWWRRSFLKDSRSRTVELKPSESW